MKAPISDALTAIFIYLILCPFFESIQQNVIPPEAKQRGEFRNFV